MSHTAWNGYRDERRALDRDPASHMPPGDEAKPVTYTGPAPDHTYNWACCGAPYYDHPEV